MHPAVILLLALALTLALQGLSWIGLAVTGGLLVMGGRELAGRWWKLLRRSRWLLLTLWVIMAYGTPGDAWHDLPWAPTEAGLAEAALHVSRLVLMLGVLSWLFMRLDRPALLSALWAALQPLRTLGVEVRALVVRIYLVFDYVESAPPAGSWRHFLADRAAPPGDAGQVRLVLPSWRAADTLVLLSGLSVLAAGVALS